MTEMTDRRDEQLKDFVCAVVELAVAVALFIRACEDVYKRRYAVEN